MSKQFTIQKKVYTLADLLNTPFKNNTNAIGWHRTLKGDFEEIATKIKLEEDITVINRDDLLALSLSEEGSLAREIILNDLQALTDFGAMPTLNLIKRYERDDTFDFISTDVYSYHVDRSPIATDTFLCTYYGATSDILPNDQAVQKIIIPEIRNKLKELFDGPENEFNAFLAEHFFDLHYQAKLNSLPTNMQIGHLWKLAVNHPAQEVLPCVHRAPVENGLRLLLIC